MTRVEPNSTTRAHRRIVTVPRGNRNRVPAASAERIRQLSPRMVSVSMRGMKYLQLILIAASVVACGDDAGSGPTDDGAETTNPSTSGDPSSSDEPTTVTPTTTDPDTGSSSGSDSSGAGSSGSGSDGSSSSESS